MALHISGIQKQAIYFTKIFDQLIYFSMSAEKEIK